jgi:hypothetical protein
VLGNFLGTYVSRYSDYQGYLLFGFLVADLGELRINLLGQTVTEPDTPLGVAIVSAAVRFEDQRQKAGLARSQLRDAWLTIRTVPGLCWGEVNGHSRSGSNLSFLVGAVLDDSKCYERERVVFIAPHNAEVELRSARFT